MAEQATRADVAETARMLVAAGLIEAFGHVSARTGDGFLITSTEPLADAAAEDVILVERNTPVDGPLHAVPLETVLHGAIYDARRDVAAICRGHSPAAVAWGVGVSDLPLLHGLGGMSGQVVRVHPDIELIKTTEAAAAVAGSLGGANSLLLRANGGLAVGSDLLEAATRLWFLEERARVALAAGRAAIEGAVRSEFDDVWQRRLMDSQPELIRAREWFRHTFATQAPAEGTGHE